MLSETRRCPKCAGNVLDDKDGRYCLQCGWRPTVKAPQPATRLVSSKGHSPEFESNLVAAYLSETNDMTELVRRFLLERSEFRAVLGDVWQEQDLEHRFTLWHLAFAESVSALGPRIALKAAALASLHRLHQGSFDIIINRRYVVHGGRPYSPRVLNLSLKLMACASYQWLRIQEVERCLTPIADAGNVRAAAYVAVKSAHSLSRRLLGGLGSDIDLVHALLTRALWEDKYRPVVINVDGVILDITY